ncbi:MAG: erythromycin esterase family protein [Actinomycetales bacterium]
MGDARATELGRRGELTLGQVVRQRHHRDAFSIGFTTHHGRVTAAIPTERNRLSLPTNLLQRAIGVVYRPETERTSHWFHADIAREFDAIIHVDESSALSPLERTPIWEAGEPEETFPTGL